MTRAQWLLLVLIGAVAAAAYIRSDLILRRLNADPYRRPSTWAA